jgi:hypothetical protein
VLKIASGWLWLAIAGAVIMPFALIGVGLGLPTGPLSHLGGLSLIIAIIIISFGYLRTSK